MSPSFFSSILRKKEIPIGNLETPLKRCLSTFDLTLFGVSHMVGAGIYVLTGSVLKNTAGPSIIISFLLAGFAAFLCALCYAELSARYPKAGSAYTYTYVGCGEIWAFIIGWNVVLEHLIGGAALARAWSGNLDTLLNNAFSNYTLEIIGPMGGNGSLITKYPDFMAVILLVVCAICVAIGSKLAAQFINAFSIANLLVMAFVIIHGSIYVDFNNWTGTDEHGKSRFFPYGFEGTLAGAATCFFSYIGFEGLGTAGEEAKDPAYSLPRATVWSMAIATLAYVLMSGVLSLMTPYELVHPTSAFPIAFAHNGANYAKYAVAAGALCAMTTAALGSLFSLPRSVYAIAADGLLFKWWAKVDERTQTPINACVCFTFLVCIMALIFDLDALVEFLSIGTLLAYAIVSACTIIIRYRPEKNGNDQGGRLRVRLPYLTEPETGLDRFQPGVIVSASATVIIFTSLALGVLFGGGAASSFFGIICLLLVAAVFIAATVIIDCHRQSDAILPFKVPFLPYLPAASVFINILMMSHLSFLTWVRFCIWMVVGMTIYFVYGIRHSTEGHSPTTVMPIHDIKLAKRAAVEGK